VLAEAGGSAEVAGLAATESAGGEEATAVATQASLVTAAGAAADGAGEGSGLARVPVQQ